MSSGKSLAVIPARGGSKRIPRKNVRPFLGKPIISYSIESALESGLFEEVMVSTDDEEIAAIGRQYGASVPFMRSEKTADDRSSINDVMKEVLDCYLDSGQSFTNVCCILSTAPFASVARLREGYELLGPAGVEAVIPVVRFSYPIQRAMKVEPHGDPEGRVSWFFDEYKTCHSQDLEPGFHDAGIFYWFKTEPFLRGGEILTARAVAQEIPELEAHDIDSDQDWLIAELKYKLMVASADRELGRVSHG